jgi:hypothetical protein
LEEIYVQGQREGHRKPGKAPTCEIEQNARNINGLKTYVVHPEASHTAGSIASLAIVIVRRRHGCTSAERVSA